NAGCSSRSTRWTSLTWTRRSSRSTRGSLTCRCSSECSTRRVSRVADANALTFGQLVADVLSAGIPSSLTGRVKRALADAYTDVWWADNWSFKRVSRETLYTTSDGTSTGTPSAAPLTPATFGDPIVLLDQYGGQ